MNVLLKPIQSITVEDLQRVCEDETPESDALELKEALSGKDGPDAWHSGADRIGDRARNAILAEVIAFANAHGGTVLLGIEETDDHPKRARAIKPIPRCADLAHRLQLMARDAIRPELSVLEVRAVPIESDAGVVILRTSESRLAPHRLEPTRESFIRRADRTQSISMREIQDLAVFRAAGIASLDAEFTRRRDLLRTHPFFLDTAATARVTLIPTAPLYMADVFRNDAVRPEIVSIPITVHGNAEHAYLPVALFNTRPILRGIRSTGDATNLQVSADVLKTGIVEYVLIEHFENTGDPSMYSSWVLALLGSALINTDKVRVAAGVPGQEFALEMELWRETGPFKLAPAGQRRILNPALPLPMKSVVLPRLPVGEPSDFPRVIGIAYQDMMNAIGLDVPTGALRIELPQTAVPSA